MHTIGAYRVVRELGRGGMGLVYEALAPDGRTVAVKLLLAATPEDLARFERETRLLRTGLPGFVPYLDSGRDARGPFVVMPLLGGGGTPPTMDEVWRARVGDGAVIAVAPAGADHVASLSADGLLQMRAVADGAGSGDTLKLQGARQLVQAGDVVLAATPAAVFIVEAPGMAMRALFPGPFASLCAVSPAGMAIVPADARRLLYFSLVRSDSRRAPVEPAAVAPLPGGWTLLATRDGRLERWSFAEQRGEVLATGLGIRGLASSADGRRALLRREDGTIGGCALDRPLERWPVVSAAEVMALSPDGSLAVLISDRRVAVFDMEQRRIAKLGKVVGRSAVFLPGGDLIVGTQRGEVVRLRRAP